MARSGTIEVRLISSGADRTRRDVDGVANSLGRLGKDVDRTAGQAGRGLDRIGGGFSRLAASAGPLAGINPVLGHLTHGLDSFGTKLSAVEGNAAAAGGALSGRLAAGANIATTALVATAAVGVGKFLQITGQVRAFQRVTGATAEDASKLVYVMHALGIDAEAAGRGLFFLARSADTKKLAEFGVTVARNRDGSADLGETLLRVSDAYNATNDSTKRADLVAAAFGARMGAQFIPILARGREGLSELNAEAAKTGLVFKQDQLDQAKNFGLAMREVEASASGLAIGLVGGVVPAITTLASVLVPIIEFLNQTRILSAALAALLARQLVIWLIAAGEASWAFVAGLVRINFAGVGATAGVAGVAGAMEVEAIAATEAAAATSLLDLAMGGLPLILGLVVGGLTLFGHHSSSASGGVDDLTTAIENDTAALRGNSDALSDNTTKWFQNKFKDHAGELRELGLSFGDVQAAITGSDKDFAALIAKLYLAGGKYRDLADLLSDVRGEFGAASSSASDFAAAGGAVSESLGGTSTALEKASGAVERFNAKLASGVEAAANVRSAQTTLANEQDKLNQVMAESPVEIHAQKLEALGKAERDVTKAHRDRTKALDKLHDIERRSLATDIERARITRERAALDAASAAHARDSAQAELNRIQGDTASTPEQIAAANQAVLEANQKVAESTQAATDAQKEYDEVASGRAREEELATAREDVATATDRVKDAERQRDDARRNAIPLSAEVAKHNREIADQLDRVVKAAEGEWAALLAGGFVTSNQAAQGLLTTLQALGPLVATNPALAAILGAAIAGAPQPAQPIYKGRPSGGGGPATVQAAEGGIAHRQMVRFAEPQTGGEAFIPRLGINSARGRALADIAASWHGGRVVPMASGGVIGGALQVVVREVPTKAPVIIQRQYVQSPYRDIERKGTEALRRKALIT